MKKHFQYLRYVLLHKWFVLVACFQFAIQYREPRLIWRGLVHDLSKFRSSEWFPYVRYFYGEYPAQNSDEIRTARLIGFYPRTKEDVQADFDMAWNYHQKRNDHHWQYWVLHLDDGGALVVEMPYRCRLEMLADWKGAGRALGKPDTKAWYLSKRDVIVLAPYTRQEVERMLDIEPVELDTSMTFKVLFWKTSTPTESGQSLA